MKDLIDMIVKPSLRTSVENVSEKAIILRRGNEDLNTKTPITGLYNTKENALEIVVNGKHCV